MICHLNVFLSLQVDFIFENSIVKILEDLRFWSCHKMDHETLDQSFDAARQFCYLEKEIITHACCRDIEENGMEESLPSGECPVECVCVFVLQSPALHRNPSWLVCVVLTSVACKHSFSPSLSRDLRHNAKKLFLLRSTLLKEQSTSGWNRNKWFI